MAADATITITGNVTPLNQAISASLNKPRSIGKLDARGFSQPLGRITGQASEFTKSLEAANARVIAFGASAGAIAAVTISFKKLVSSMIDVEAAFTDINVLLNASEKGLAKFGAGLFTIANQTATSWRDAAVAAQEFSRQGLNAADTLERTRSALILAKLSGSDFGNAVTSITAAINSFNSEALTSIQIVDRLAAVDARFAVSADDLAEGIKRVGSSASDANVSLNQTLALLTAAQQTTARSGSVLGNSFKTIFTRMQRPAVLKQLEEVGVRTRTATGETRPLVDVLSDLAKRYDTLIPSQKAYTAEVVGGVFQINVLKAVLSDLGGGFSIYQGALKAAAQATGEAESRISQLNETIQAKLIQTFNSFTQLGSQIGLSAFEGPIKALLDFSKSFAEGSSAALSGEGFGASMAKGFLQGFGGIISGPGIQLLVVGILSLFKRLTSFAAQSIAEFSNINSKSRESVALQRQVNEYLKNNPAILKQIHSGTLSISQVHSSILQEINQENALMREQARLATIIAGRLQKSGIRSSAISSGGGRADGFVPNFSAFREEEAQARGFGAKAGVRAHMSKGTIGGSRFVMNNQETEIPRYGRNGDSAVLPSYSSGHIPNFNESGGRPKWFRSTAFKGDGFGNALVGLGMSSEQIKGLGHTGDAKWKKLVELHGLDTMLGLNDKKQELGRTGAARVSESSASNLAGATHDISKKLAMIVPGRKSTGLGVKRAEGKDKNGKKSSLLLSSFGIHAEPTDALYKDVENSIVNSADKYVRTLQRGINPKPIGDDFKKGIAASINPGTLQAAIGTVFESAMNSSIGKAGGKHNEGIDYSSREVKKMALFLGGGKKGGNSQARDLLRFGAGKGVADAKSGFSQANFKSMVKKAHNAGLVTDDDKIGKVVSPKKGKAAGFIPNFSDALGMAVQREKDAGIPSGSIRVGSDAGLVSRSNPSGLGIYNTIQETSLADGMNKSRRAGINPRNKGRAAGFVPNFVEGGDVGMSAGLGALQFVIPQMQEMISGVKLFNGEIGKLEKSLSAVPVDKLNSNLNKTKEEVIKFGSGLGTSGISAKSSEKDIKEFLKKTSSGTGDLAKQARKLSKAYTTAGSKVNAFVRDTEKLGGLKKAQDAKSTKTRGRAGIALGASFVAPMLPAMVDFAAGLAGMAGPAGNAKKALTGMAQGATLAAQIMSVLPGPIGLVAGVATFLYKSIKAYIDSNKGLTDAQRVATERTLDRNKSLQSSLTAFLQADRKMVSAANSTSLGYQDLQDALKNQAKAMRQVRRDSPEVAAKLATASTPKEKARIVAEAQQESSRVQQASTIALGLNKRITSGDKISQKDFGKVAKSSFDLVKDKDIEGASRATSIRDFGLPKELAESLLKTGVESDKLIKAMRAMAIENIRSKDVLKAYKEATIDERNAKSQLLSLQERISKGAESIVEARRQELKSMIDFSGRVRSNFSKVFSPFMTEGQKIEQNTKSGFEKGVSSSFLSNFKSSASESGVEGKQLDRIRDKLFPLINNALQDGKSGDVPKILTDIRNSSENIQVQRLLNELIGKQTNSNTKLAKIAAETSKVESAVLKTKSDIAVGGGLKALLDRNKIVNNKSDIRTSGRRAMFGGNSRIRAAGAVDSIGGFASLLGGMGRVPSSLKQRAIGVATPGVQKGIVEQLQNAKRSAFISGDQNSVNEINKLIADSGNIAKKQLEAQFKMLAMPDNISQMNDKMSQLVENTSGGMLSKSFDEEAAKGSPDGQRLDLSASAGLIAARINKAFSDVVHIDTDKLKLNIITGAYENINQTISKNILEINEKLKDAFKTADEGVKTKPFNGTAVQRLKKDASRQAAQIADGMQHKGKPGGAAALNEKQVERFITALNENPKRMAELTGTVQEARESGVTQIEGISIIINEAEGGTAKDREILANEIIKKIINTFSIDGIPKKPLPPAMRRPASQVF